MTRPSISFEPLASDYDATRGGLERGAAFAADLARFVVGEPVLEVGAGTGAVALGLQELTGLAVAGVDLSPGMLAHALARLGPRVAVGDAERLPVASGSVGTVVMVWVLQLVPDIGAVIAELGRVLRPGGHLAMILSRPVQGPDDIDYLERLLFERLGPRAGDGPHRVADIAREKGFEVVDMGETTEQRWDQTPVDAALRLERRQYAALLHLDAARFEEVVVPIAEALRALPEPDRPRHRTSRHPYVFCELRLPETTITCGQ